MFFQSFKVLNINNFEMTLTCWSYLHSITSLELWGKNSHMEHKRCSLKTQFIRGTCVCVGNEGYTIKQPKCWKNHPFPSLRSEAFKCLRRVCGSPSRAIAGHPYFSITLCTSHEHHNICGTYFTALLAVATRA